MAEATEGLEGFALKAGQGRVGGGERPSRLVTSEETGPMPQEEARSFLTAGSSTQHRGSRVA